MAAAPSYGSTGASQGKVNGAFSMTDSTDQPKLKGQSRMRRTRMSIRKRLQKHGLARADSDSDLEDEEESESERISVHEYTQ